LVAASALAAESETVMSEAAHLADRLACGGRHGDWEQAYGIITLRAAITALPACPIGHLAVCLITQP
jgi:hypothetical protein